MFTFLKKSTYFMTALLVASALALPGCGKKEKKCKAKKSMVHKSVKSPKKSPSKKRFELK